jgi:predicted DNA-binding protein
MNRPRGRPVTTGETPKWQFRCPLELRERITALADKHGETATQFILTAMLERAERLKPRKGKG